MLHYQWTEDPTGKPGHLRVKDVRIDFSNLDTSNASRLDIDPADGQAFNIKAHCKSLGRVVSLVLPYLPKGGYRLFFCTDVDMAGIDMYMNTIGPDSRWNSITGTPAVRLTDRLPGKGRTEA